MKTAEEWLNNEVFQYNETPSNEDFLPVIKQIQLDAWKQGMTDAHAILTSDHNQFHCMECGTEEFDHANAIKEACDNKITL